MGAALEQWSWLKAPQGPSIVHVIFTSRVHRLEKCYSSVAKDDAKDKPQPRKATALSDYHARAICTCDTCCRNPDAAVAA